MGSDGPGRLGRAGRTSGSFKCFPSEGEEQRSRFSVTHVGSVTSLSINFAFFELKIEFNLKQRYFKSNTMTSIVTHVIHPKVELEDPARGRMTIGMVTNASVPLIRDGSTSVWWTLSTEWHDRVTPSGTDQVAPT